MEIDLSELVGWNDALAKAPEELDKQMIISTNVALSQGTTMAKENAPFQDGDLSGDIRVMKKAAKVSGGYGGKFGTDLDYSAQREYGGTIYPRNGGLLVFEWKEAISPKNPAGLVFAKSVTQEGKFYMRDAQRELERMMPRMYQAGINKALRSIGS